MNAYTDERSTAAAYVDAWIQSEPKHHGLNFLREDLIKLVQHVIDDVIDDQPL
jgi:hypothetical protein